MNNQQQNFFQVKKVNFFSRHKLAIFVAALFVVTVGVFAKVFFITSVTGILHASADSAGLSAIQAAPTAIFSDVDSNHPNAEAIAYLKQHHILNGYLDGSFKPDNFVTRAELIKFLFDALEIAPTPVIYHSCFKDVKDDWFAPYVCYATAESLISGYSDKTFLPNKNVTLVEALKIMLTAYHTRILQSAPISVIDVDSNAWYTPYIWTAYGKKLITWDAVAGSSQIPNLTATTVTTQLLKRSELAEILYRLNK